MARFFQGNPPFSMKWMLRVCMLVGMCHSITSAKSGDAPPRSLNVLFIAVDDLRPQLGCYEHVEMVTPNIDRLARDGRRFNHHYVQVPTCGASRCAMLTGQYPATPSAYGNGAVEALPRSRGNAPLSLPGLFKNHGYETVAIGKISHAPDGLLENGQHELPESWHKTTMPHGKWKDAWSAFFAYADGTTRVVRHSPVAERAEVSDRDYPDGLIADAAIAELKELQDKPFFLAVGFIKPHLPFNAPARYWDLYDPDSIPAPSNTLPPKNVDPKISLHTSGEMRGQYTGFSTPGAVTDSEARYLRHAYCACVSYVDAQIGRVLQALDELGLRDNTIVVLWGDHGWHLGEHGIWGKHTLHEVSLRSPLIVRVPGMEKSGEAANGIVETVDIYPTLAELCNLPISDGLSGKSFVSLLHDPERGGKATAFGFWKNGRGHTVRTSRYRFTEWNNSLKDPQVIQTELYDHQADPGETVNIASEMPEIADELSRILHENIPLPRK